MAGSSFRFELAPVLQLRDRAVELATAALGRAVQARMACEAQVSEATASLNESLDGHPTAPRTVHQLGGAAAHREVRARTLREAVQSLDRSRAEERRAQRELNRALREREALETLRTEAVDAHRVQALRSEASRLDDLVTTGHARTAPGSIAASSFGS